MLVHHKGLVLQHLQILDGTRQLFRIRQLPVDRKLPGNRQKNPFLKHALVLDGFVLIGQHHKGQIHLPLHQKRLRIAGKRVHNPHFDTKMPLLKLRKHSQQVTFLIKRGYGNGQLALFQALEIIHLVNQLIAQRQNHLSVLIKNLPRRCQSHPVALPDK